MTISQLRKINVIIKKQMITIDQNRLLMTLLLHRDTTINELCDIYFGANTNAKSFFRKSHMRRYLKDLMLKLDYWGLPFIITVAKDETVNLTMKEE